MGAEPNVYEHDNDYDEEFLISTVTNLLTSLRWYGVREGSPVEVQWAIHAVGRRGSVVGRICGTGEF